MALNFANNNSLSAITTLPASISGGDMTLLATQTASGSANISFTSGIDSTYDSYVFKFIDIHPSASGDGNKFQFNFSTDGGSNYNVTKTTTAIRVWHYENDSETGLDYHTGGDLTQSTNFQVITEGLNNDNDHGASGTMSLFNPSSTVFVKHFITETSSVRPGDINYRYMSAGYGNTTSSIDAVRFQISSGNIDSGVIKLYGIS